MSEWDDKINKLLVEVDALDDNPDKSALDALWLKVLTIATGVQNPPAETLGELVNDVLDCFNDFIIDSCSEQLDEVFSRIEALYRNPDSEPPCNIWCDFFNVIYGELTRIDEFKKLVHCVLTPSGAIDIKQDDDGLLIEPHYQDEEVKPPISEEPHSQDDLEIIREAEEAMAVEVPSTVAPPIASKDVVLQWPAFISQLPDEEIILSMNRVFGIYGFDVQLLNPNELHDKAVFASIRSKLKVSETIELRDETYKTSWSIIYNRFLKSKGVVFTKVTSKSQTIQKPVQPVEHDSKESSGEIKWASSIDDRNDEDIVSIFNRLFSAYQIHEHLQNIEELQQEERFVEVRNILSVKKSYSYYKTQYKKSWSIIYFQFLKAQGITFPRDGSDEQQSVHTPKQVLVKNKKQKKSHFGDSKEEYLQSAIKHLDACKAILIAHDLLPANIEYARQLILEEIHYLMGYILECSAKSLVLNEIDWNGDNLEILDSPEKSIYREEKHVCWKPCFAPSETPYIILSSHFNKLFLKSITDYSFCNTVFRNVPLFNGLIDSNDYDGSDDDRLLLNSILHNDRIHEVINSWNTSLRYRDLPSTSSMKINKEEAVMIIALCDKIVKAVIKIVRNNKQLEDSFSDLVSRYLNKDQQTTT